jgi:DNA-binding CsgD family transcriptional regulator
LLALVAEVLEHAGRAHFYDFLASRLSRLFNCTQHVAMRYSQYARPAFLVNNALSDVAATAYLEHLYRIDPLYNLVRAGGAMGVVTLRSCGSESDHVEYCDALFRYTGISDELAIMLPLFGGLVVAICLDCGTRSFSERRVRLARALYPFLEQAHRLHLERSLPGGGYGFLDGGATGVLVTGCDREIVFKNAAWTSFESSHLAEEIRRFVQLASVGKVRNVGDSVLHGHRLETSSAICPDGTIFFIEPKSPGSISVDITTLLERFASAHRLSPRERDLFTMALKGCDNRAIATQLFLSPGTVKNYKQRLYAKLGVRSEREMYPLLIGLLAGSDAK